MNQTKAVYIASSSQFIGKCKQLAQTLQLKYRMNITRKWWEHYLSDASDFKDISNREFLAHPHVEMVRELDFKAVRDADLVIVIVEDQYKLTGAMVEIGYALGIGKPVIVFGKAKRSAMLSSCIHVETSDQLFVLLDRMETESNVYGKLRCFLDGDSLCVVPDNFENLQESDAIFLELSIERLNKLKSWSFERNRV
jgi:nucleoside 2-deoxyribosyltransferase